MLIDKLKESFDKNVMEDSSVKTDRKQYPSMFRNTIAFSADFFIIGCIRMFFILISSFFIKGYQQNFITKFEIIYGNISKFDLTSANHRNMLFHSSFGKGLLTVIIMCVVIGMIYNIYYLQTKKCATLGRRLAKIYIIDKNGKNLTLFRSIIRCLLSYLPWGLPILAYLLWDSYKGFAIGIIVLSCIWSDTYLFSGKRIAIHDIILGTTPCIGRVG